MENAMLFVTSIYQVKDCFELFMMPHVSIIVNAKYFQDPYLDLWRPKSIKTLLS